MAIASSFLLVIIAFLQVFIFICKSFYYMFWLLVYCHVYSEFHPEFYCC